MQYSPSPYTFIPIFYGTGLVQPAHTHTHTLGKKLKSKTPAGKRGIGQLSFSSGHQNNEGDIVMWLGAFLRGAVGEIVMTGNSTHTNTHRGVLKSQKKSLGTQTSRGHSLLHILHASLMHKQGRYKSSSALHHGRHLLTWHTNAHTYKCLHTNTQTPCGHAHTQETP